MAIVKKTTLDTNKEKIGQDIEKEISVTGKAEIIKETVVETVKGPDLGPVAELEKFMNEVVEILVYEPFEMGQENVVQTAVNGKNQFIVRGVPQRVKRKYVEVLARARKVNVSADGFKDPNGEAKNTVRVTSGLQYPFQVVEDSNPKGPAWLRQILAEV